MMRSSNPALSSNPFEGFGRIINVNEQMTIQGTALKTGFLLLLSLLTAGWTWMVYFQSGANPDAVSGYMMLGLIGGLGCAIATIFKKSWAPYTASAYALLEGFLIGGLSAIMEQAFAGIVIQAAGLTFGTLAAMLLIYQSGFIEVNNKFRLGVFAATGGIALVYLVSFILGFFGVSVPVIYGNGAFGILFSLFVVGIAALNLVLDFDFIEQGARQGAPRYMEWYGAFALMVTLIWLYIEFLRLLSKVRSR